MPTKRTRRTHNMRQRITPEAVEHFRAALPLQDRYLDCIRADEDCGRALGGVHCVECAQYLEHVRRLRAALHLKPWEPDPLIDDGELRQELVAYAD